MSTIKTVNENSNVFLVDGSGYIFRAYHALPPLTRKSDGLPTNAVHGFCNMLNKLIREANNGNKPTHFAVIFDKSRYSFRNEIYPQYKAHREEPPEELIPQFELIRKAVRAFNIPYVEQKGLEADDIIATYATQAEKKGANVFIISSDKDLMQLVSEKVIMVDTMKNKRIGINEVIEKFGVPPQYVIDVQSLAGDTSDNVPGVPGIGIKTGAELIRKYGNLDILLEKSHEIKQPARRKNLTEHADIARLSRQLITLKKNANLKTHIDALTIQTIEPEKTLAFLKAMEFETLTKRIAQKFNIDPNDIKSENISVQNNQTVVKKEKKAEKQKLLHNTPQENAAEIAENIKNIPIEHHAYITITDKDDLQKWVKNIYKNGIVAVDTETTSLNAMRAEIVGISLAIKPNHACYIPIAHQKNNTLSFEDSPTQITLNEAIHSLKPILENPEILKIGQNIKYDKLVFLQHHVDLQPSDDTMLLSYALDSGRGRHAMDALSVKHLNHKPIAYNDITGSGRNKIPFQNVSIENATKYAAEDADVTLRLWHLLKPRLVSEKKTTIYEKLERPLIPILVNMEKEGVMVDRNILARLSMQFNQKMKKIEEKIYQIAGEKFNIASPKQLGDILFTKMKLEGAKKTPTGTWSTDAQMLEKLAAEGHKLPQKILKWRHFAKLKNTYSDALPEFINPKTGRIHTSYSMAATSTGRLASSEPNLQNIPIRTPEGRNIRTAFIAKKGHLFISADYSQIELRILAHIANLEALKKAFKNQQDIHAMTAAQMFKIPINDVNPDMRRRAKAINFGIIYGISSYGLANQLAISRTKADQYIKNYFKQFPGIQEYMEETKNFCRKNGYVQTIFGRKCHFQNINSKNIREKMGIERAAINAPIQGTAADIIRRAMIKMHKILEKYKLKTKMILQVHDELIFETPEEEANNIIEIACNEMQNAAEPAIKMDIPLKVEARGAKNWDDAH